MSRIFIVDLGHQVIPVNGPLVPVLEKGATAYVFRSFLADGTFVELQSGIDIKIEGPAVWARYLIEQATNPQRQRDGVFYMDAYDTPSGSRFERWLSKYRPSLPTGAKK